MAGAVILAAVLLLGLMFLAYWPKARQAEHTHMQALAAGMLERFSDAELAAELHRRLRADPDGFVRRVKTGEQLGDSSGDLLAAELSMAESEGFASGRIVGRFGSR